MKAREIKEDLLFNTEFMGLLEVMKNIAISQFRSLQKKRSRFIRFTQLLNGFFQMVDIRQAPHKLINPKTEKRAIVSITSDEGFMGDLNFQVVDAAIMKGGPESAEIIVVGESGVRYLKDMGRKFTAFKNAADAEARHTVAVELKNYIMRGIAEDRFGRVSVYYPNPISFMIQKVEAVELLPLTAFFSPQAQGPGYDQQVIVESPAEGIIEYLAEEFIEQKLMELLEDSKLSEFAARGAHLERSGQELAEKQKRLRAQYFHAYHEVIDKNTRELFSSQIIIKRKAKEVSAALNLKV
ncbi:MAG: F0F1 ATP synthase subunit gamma [Candidatus Omnitrophica bacterium]|nr:F0F1 ATP synthase subunit gamma [Candidatus Omnitrophota bacterium]